MEDREEQTKKLADLIYNPKTGVTNLKNFLYEAVKDLEIMKFYTKDQLIDFYNDQEVSQTMKPFRNNYGKIQSPSYLWSVQADLMDISNEATSNNNFHWVLVCIDVYSRYAWAYLLKNKTADSVNKAFELFLKEVNAKGDIKGLAVDNGSEYISKSFVDICNKADIKIWYSRPDSKNLTAVIERFIRTLRSRILKYKINYNTKVWYNKLDDFMYNYNHSVHSSIDMTPAIKRTLKAVESDMIAQPINQFKVGDRVRYLKKKDIFAKEGKKYSQTIHTIAKIERNRIWLEKKPGDQMYFLPRELMKIGESKTASDYGIERQPAKNDVEDKLVKARTKGRRALTEEEINKLEIESIALTRPKREIKIRKK